MLLLNSFIGIFSEQSECPSLFHSYTVRTSTTNTFSSFVSSALTFTSVYEALFEHECKAMLINNIEKAVKIFLVMIMNFVRVPESNYLQAPRHFDAKRCHPF